MIRLTILALIFFSLPAHALKRASQAEKNSISGILNQIPGIDSQMLLSSQTIRIEMRKYKPNFQLIDSERQNIEKLRDKKRMLVQEAIRKTIAAYDIAPVDANGSPSLALTVHARGYSGETHHWVPVYYDMPMQRFSSRQRPIGSERVSRQWPDIEDDWARQRRLNAIKANYQGGDFCRWSYGHMERILYSHPACQASCP